MSTDVKTAHLRIVKPSTEAQKETLTTLDTIVVTPAIAKSWKKPWFQRPLSETKKLAEVAEKIKNTEIIPGIITLGVIDKALYLIDGQHRREAFYRSGVTEAFVDVRYLHFKTEAEMSEEFVEVNGRIANFKADDILRGHEAGHEGLRRIRRECSFVGYDNIRRSDRTPVVAMSALLRCWFGTAPETPSTGGMSAASTLERLTEDETGTLLSFAELAFKAWGRDQAHHRLWGNLNLIICMWLYRRLVITPYSANVKKITKELFLKCLMSLGASQEYNDWLLGRQFNKHCRAPTYQRIKHMFARRLEEETGVKPRLPSPEWGGR